MSVHILTGDCIESMQFAMADQSVQTCVTSPPYFGLRDYGCDGQIGLEQTPAEYVAKLVDVFREVRRVLRDDGTLWLNLGDSYARDAAKGGSGPGGKNRQWYGENYGSATSSRRSVRAIERRDAPGVRAPEGQASREDAPAKNPVQSVLAAEPKAKDLLGIPWRVAFALQADGWYLRQDIIWHKPNPMPESVRDRCTKAHEYIFLLAKSEKYYFDSKAIQEPATNAGKRVTLGEKSFSRGQSTAANREPSGNALADYYDVPETRNRRSVWTVTTKPYKGAHFATFPPDLIEPCVLAGSKPGDTVLDPFGGSGTTGMVAKRHGRNAILCELNPEYVTLAEARCR